MTEKEKRDRGELYDANYDETLLKEMQNTKKICFELNSLAPDESVARKEILERLLGSAGRHCVILSPFHCDYGYNIHVGENFFANHGCVMLDGARITIGDNVFIGPLCGFYTATHPLDFERRNRGLEWAKPITIGNNVWIGGGVHIMAGVTIGDNTVIGGGSVVTHDIPCNVLAVGNPCNVLRTISNPLIPDSLDGAASCGAETESRQ